MRRLFICVGILFTAAVFGAAAQSFRLDWRYPTGGQIRSQPAAGGTGSVYALSDDGFVYAFAPSGRSLWAANLGGLVTDSFSVGRDGTVYAGLLDGTVDAVNPRGRLIWSFPAGGTLMGNPATADDGTVFIATTNGTLSSVSLNGALEWKITLPARMTQPPVLDAQETLYLGASDGRLYALTRWGRFKWSLPLPGIPRSAAVAADGSVYLLVSDNQLVKVSPAGNLEWKRALAPESFGPLIGEKRILVAARDGSVSAFNPDGKAAWQQKVSGPVGDSWVVGEGTVYLMGARKQLIALDEATGNPKGELRVDAAGTLALSATGELLVGGRDWLVYAYTGIASGDSAQWGQPSSDSRHSGHGKGRFDLASSAAALDKIPDYLALRLQLDPVSRGSLVRLLGEVGARVKSGEAGKSTWYLRLLVEKAVGTGILNPIIEGNSVVNDFPTVRATAAELLGSIGSLDSRTTLIRVLSQEDDPYAASAEIAALGEIESDGDGASTRAIAAAVDRFSGSPAGGDARVAYAAVRALGSIAHYEGALPDSSGGITLLSIYRGPYPASVSESALALLKNHSP